MKYIDRKGNITIEENSQDKLLRHLYNDRGGRLCLKLLIRPFVSKAAGIVLNTRLSARFVPDFAEHNKIDLSLYEKQNFSSWNDFFKRRIRKEERPIDMRENILVSPCDGKLSVHRISSDSRFNIKDTEYTVGQLLKNEQLARRYTDGYALIFRLTVDDYHHYCYVADGRKSENVTLPGVFHTVNPAANDVYPIYKENAREYCLLKTEKFGTILMMEVGAMMVGKISNLQKKTATVKKGQEKGNFEFGGSTVILLLQPGKVRIDYDLLDNTEEGYETIVKMGERVIGEATRQALKAHGFQADLMPKEYCSQSLAEALINVLTPSDHVLLARSKDGSVNLSKELEKQDIFYKDLALYHVKGKPLADGTLLSQCSHLVFGSASGAKAFLKHFQIPAGVKVIAIGPVTGKALREAGVIPYMTGNSYDIPGILKGLTEEKTR